MMTITVDTYLLLIAFDEAMIIWLNAVSRLMVLVTDLKKTMYYELPNLYYGLLHFFLTA